MAAPAPAFPAPSSIDDLLTIYSLNHDSETNQVTIPSPDPSHPADLVSTLQTINELTQFLARGPFPHCPPPPPPPTHANPRSAQLNQIKEQGNQAFGQGNHVRAIELYTVAADVAVSRPLFENSAWVKEELSIVLCNRCAAYMGAKKWVEALADAEVVIGLKRNWSKGHFRKGKCLLLMGRLDEAKDAILLGLEFEPDNKDLLTLATQVDESISKAASRATIEAAPTSLVSPPGSATSPTLTKRK